MSLKTFFAFCPLMLISIFWTVKSIPECPTCGTVMCPPQPEDCTYGVEMDICGCCFVCNKRPGKMCLLSRSNNFEKELICKWIRILPYLSPYAQNNEISRISAFENEKPKSGTIDSRNFADGKVKIYRYKTIWPVRKHVNFPIAARYLTQTKNPVKHISVQKLDAEKVSFLRDIFSIINKMQRNSVSRTEKTPFRIRHLKSMDGSDLSDTAAKYEISSLPIISSPWILIHEGSKHHMLNEDSGIRSRRQSQESTELKGSGTETEKSFSNETETTQLPTDKDISSRIIDDVMDGVSSAISSVGDGIGSVMALIFDPVQDFFF